MAAKTAWNNPTSTIVERAADLYADAKPGERTALHVAVLLRVYPIILDVLEQAGTRVQLDDRIRQSAIRDRLVRQYGAKANVQQGVQKVLQTLVSWRLLEKLPETGVYKARPSLPLSAEVGEVLVASAMEARGREAYPAEDLRRDPALFLFTLPRDLARGPLLRQFRDGSGQLYFERT